MIDHIDHIGLFKLSGSNISGAAAYTGAVTHTLSVAVIICELTGQLTALLPVLVPFGPLTFQLVDNYFSYGHQINIHAEDLIK